MNRLVEMSSISVDSIKQKDCEIMKTYKQQKGLDEKRKRQNVADGWIFKENNRQINEKNPLKEE